MKRYKLLLFLLLSFFACNEDHSIFEVSTDGLKFDSRPVPGGAMFKYSLPDNSDIFSINIRYQDSRGNAILKSAGYGGDSILLDGFTRSEKAVAQLTFSDNYGKESTPIEFEFSTEDSAPWSFFNEIEVSTSWDGFQIMYGKTTIATGMAHVFYLGLNPMTQKNDTILVRSFPINAKGDTLHFIPKQEKEIYSVVVRTEDFAGYRVRQEIYPNVASYSTEQKIITQENYNDNGLSVENHLAKTGLKYLFDGELRGRERFLNPAEGGKEATIVFGAYVAGPQAIGSPLIIDLKEERAPAKIRFYTLYEKMGQLFAPVGPNYPLGEVWNGFYEDKVPCKATIYGTNNLSDADGWVKLGTLDEDPKAEFPWYLAPKNTNQPSDLADLESRDPLFIDIMLPPSDKPYRYLKCVIDGTYDLKKSNGIDYNKQKYFMLTELEVFVKKNSL